MKKSNQEILREVEQNYVKGNLKKSLEILKSLFEGIDEIDLYKETLLALNQLSSLESNTNKGIISPLEIEYNRVRNLTVEIFIKAKDLFENKNYSPIENISKNELKLVFEDYFENNDNKWEIIKDNDEIFIINGGRLKIKNNRFRGATANCIYKKMERNRNFIIKSKVKHIQGSTNDGFGIIWGMNDDKDDIAGHGSISFIINAYGCYSISYSQDNKIYNIKNWTEHSAVKKDSQSNKLEVQRKGEILYFSINDKIVSTTDHISFFGDYIGFAVHGQQTITFEYLKIWN